MASTSSLDVLDLIDPDFPQLLQESLSSIPSVVLDESLPVPPFPVRPMRPMPPLFDSRSESPTGLTLIPSIATLPRFAKSMHEPLCLHVWLRNSRPSDASDDIPWGGIRPTRSDTWHPEGSLHSPGDFQAALRAARNPPRSRQPPATPAVLRPPLHSPSYREALVFKREITLTADGKPKRWSLQVPATTMDPEIVDIMLELQDLNSFFKHGLQHVDHSVAALDQQKHKIHPPSLVVSDSHTALPLVLDPSEHPQCDPSLPLAARRGKDLLPPLFITVPNHTIAQSSYPSIPSAFMGSPSAYSPKFQGALEDDDSSPGLGDMIATLKSKCTYPQQSTHDDSQVVESPVSAMSFASPSEQIDSEDDDWAFAVSLLTEFGTQPEQIIGKMGLSSRSELSLRDETPPTASNLLSAADNLTSSSIAKPLQSCTPSPCSPPGPAPAAALPSTPPSTPSNRPSSPKGVRSILKSCKNVRFASLPEKPENFNIKPLVLNPPSPPLTHSTISHLRRPLRTRTIHRASKLVTEDKQTVTAGSYLPTPSHSHVNPKLGTSLPPSPIHQSFSPSKTPSPLSRTVSPLRISARHSASAASARKSITLGRTSKSDLDKENSPKPASSTPRATTTSRWTMNDMTFRRGSNISQPNPEGTPRSRMPVPLRNILTRFK